MDIFIDDSMWGELIGGVLIGFYIPDKILETRYIDVSFFQGSRFTNKEYIDEGERITLKWLNEHDVKKSDSLYLCRGYLITEIAKRLVKQGYMVTSMKITGELQNFLVEQNHKKLSEIIKDPSFFRKKGAQFNKLVDWVNEDLKNREKFVKTGWKKWNKYRKSRIQ